MTNESIIKKLIHKLSGVEYRNESAVKDIVRLIVLEMNTTLLPFKSTSDDEEQYTVKAALLKKLMSTLDRMKILAQYKDDVEYHNNFRFHMHSYNN